MRPPFEVWAPQEIAQLRAEADALQRTLDRYLGQPSVDSSAKSQTDGGAASAPSRAARSRASSGTGRPTKHGHILDLIDQAGAAGLTTDEIESASVAAGHPIKRNSLRSFLWTQRSDGRLIQIGGRHVSVKYKNHGEPEGETSNSPDPHEGAA
jgi:hypothetical protein